MTPIEKAEELVNKFIQYTPAEEEFEFIYAVQCALIAVDEIINSMSRYDDLIEEDLKREFGIEFFSCEVQNMDGDFRYWQQVRTEIQNL
jgi:hypothetical protein